MWKEHRLKEVMSIYLDRSESIGAGRDDKNEQILTIVLACWGSCSYGELVSMVAAETSYAWRANPVDW